MTERNGTTAMAAERLANMERRAGAAGPPGLRERMIANRAAEQAERERGAARAAILAGAVRFDRREAWRVARMHDRPAATLSASMGSVALNAAATIALGDAERVAVWTWPDGRLAIEADPAGAFRLTRTGKGTGKGSSRFAAADLVRSVLAVPVSKRPGAERSRASARYVGDVAAPGLVVFAPAAARDGEG